MTSRRSCLKLLGLGVAAFPGWSGCRKKAQPTAEPTGPGSPVASDALTVRRFEVTVRVGRSRFTQNVYVVSNPRTRDALIVDPGAADARVERHVTQHKLRVHRILNTHGHPDHIGGNGTYAKRYGAAVWAHAADAALYASSPMNRPTELFRAQRALRIPGLPVAVIHTPGHTPGSVCYRMGELLLTGDTLFRGSIGRTWGTPTERRLLARQEVHHIKTRLLVLPPQTRVLPGHGESSTIGEEQRSNRHLR